MAWQLLWQLNGVDVTTMELRDRIQELLGQGLATSVVASAVGCDPSYISQLMEDIDFRESVVVSRSRKVESQVVRDNKWDAIEDAALERAQKTLPFVQKPSELIKIAALANAAKRRTAEAAGVSENAAPIVQLILPEAAAIHFQMNRESQVISVEGRSMQALPTKSLAKLVAEDTLQVEDARTVEIPAMTKERKKVESILEQIGFADEPVPVPSVLSLIS